MKNLIFMLLLVTTLTTLFGTEARSQNLDEIKVVDDRERWLNTTYKGKEIIVYMDGREATKRAFGNLTKNQIESLTIKENIVDGKDRGYCAYIKTKNFKYGILSESQYPLHKAIVESAESANAPKFLIDGVCLAAHDVAYLYTDDIERIEIINDSTTLAYFGKRYPAAVKNGLINIRMKDKSLSSKQYEADPPAHTSLPMTAKAKRNIAEYNKAHPYLILLDGEEVIGQKERLEASQNKRLFQLDSAEAVPRYGKKAAGGMNFMTKHPIIYSISCDKGIYTMMTEVKELSYCEIKKATNPLLFVDGEPVSNLSNISDDKIKYMWYKEGFLAKLQYGDVAKGGVVSITTNEYMERWKDRIRQSCESCF